MANLVIDIGNTHIKLAVFNGHEMLDTSRYEFIDIDTVSGIVHKYKVTKAIISSVKGGNLRTSRLALVPSKCSWLSATLIRRHAIT